MTTAARVLEVARGQLGYQEGWNGRHWTNVNKFGAAFGADGQPWCAWFVRWVMEQAGAQAGSYPTSGSCTLNMNWARDRHRWYTSAGRAGDIAIFNAAAGGRRAVHTGIVERVVSTGVYDCIEGNTNNTGSAEGNAVVRHRRKADRILGFIRPDYYQPPPAQEATVTVPVTPVPDTAKGAVLELGERKLDRGAWHTVARFNLDNSAKRYNLSTHLLLGLDQTSGERPAYAKLRWAREGWGKAKAGELDTTATDTHAVPAKLKASCPFRSAARKLGGGVMAVQVYIEGDGVALVKEIVADANC